MRLSPLEELTARQAEISERIASRRGGTRGPFLIWLRSPELCERVEALGAFCRFESSLPLRLRELSLLIAARHFDAAYSWNAHADKAVEAGLPAESIEQLARNEVPDFGDDEDAAILHRFATEVLRDHFVSDETFAAGLAAFGEQGLVDLIGSLGNYSMLAMLLNTFQVDPKPGWTDPYPDVRGFAKIEPQTSLKPASA
ncbi:carboxymuconolactone decarboxylase family protein [Cryptosporangium minutisporangium]|uniref:carboxymuconolactone decarboxylase family protein n=1 Tax=Cryptosporangium minutisporangium TaxID=113569 RepID=UPI0031EAF8F4